MTSKKLFVAACAASVGLATLIGTIATADPAKDTKPAAADLAKAGQGEMQLPPGWTMEDMQACMAAGTPGKMHERLAKEVGTWSGKSTMWMMPKSEPVVTDSTATVTALLDGRFVKTEWAGEMPGMGPYSGFGLHGFDNVTGKFSAVWLDNHGTGMMLGTGELSPDGKAITWTYNYTCPLNKKPTVMKQVETRTGPNTKTLEMWGPEPKSGEVYKIMSIELTRK